MIDTDSECHLSRRLLKMEASPLGLIPPIHTLYDDNESNEGWRGRSSIEDIYTPNKGVGVVPYPTAIANLEIVPAEQDLLQRIDKISPGEAEKPNMVWVAARKRLRLFVQNPDVESAYDLIVIDTPPNQRLIAQAAMHAATHALIPAKLRANCAESLHRAVEIFAKESSSRDASDELKIVGVIPCFFRDNEAQNRVLNGLLRDSVIAPSLASEARGWDRKYSREMGAGDGCGPMFKLPANNKVRIKATQVCTQILLQMGFPVESAM